MEEANIKTPFLSISVWFFGFLGFQLTPILKNGVLVKEPCLVVLLINGIINCTVLYSLSYQDPFFSVVNYEEVASLFKPLLGNVIRFNMQYCYPLSFLLNKIFYAIYGRAIIRLLDSTYLFEVYREKHRRKLTQMFTLFVLTVSLEMDAFLNTYQEDSSVLVKCIKFLAIFSIGSDIFFIFGIALYFKMGTCQALKGILTRARILKCHTAVRVLGGELREMALVSEQFNGLLSIPLLTYFASTIIDCIGLICINYYETIDVLSITYLALVFFSALYLAFLDQQTERLYSQIVEHLRYCPGLQLSSHLAPIKWFSLRRSTQIYIEELALYQDYLPMRLFSLCHLDYAFVCICTFVVIENSLLIIQTSLR